MRLRSLTPYVILAAFPCLGWLWLTLTRSTFFDPYVFADYFPRFAWAQQQLLAGHLPLFSSGYAHGFPMYVDHFGLIHPLVLFVLKTLPLFLGYHTLIFFGFFLGSALAYRYGRAFGLQVLSALFFAFAYTYSGIQVYWARELAWTGALIFFPLIMLLATFLAKRAWWWMVVGGVLLGATFAITFIEMALYATALAAAWSVWNDLRGGWRQSHLRTTKRFCGMMLIAGMIGAPWLVPAIAFVAETNRASGSTLFVHTSGGGLGIGDLFQAFFPSLTFPYNPFSWLQFSSEGARLFVGIIPLLFLFFAAHKKKKRSEEWFYWCATIVALLVLLPFLPFADLFYRLPFLHFFRFAWKWLFPFLFCISLLAASGFDHLFFAEGATVSKRVWWWLRGLALVGILVPLGVWIGFSLFRGPLLAFAYDLFARRGFAGTLERSLSYYHEVIDTAYAAVVHGVSFTNPAMIGSILGLLFLAALPWLFVRYARQRVATMTVAALACVLFFGTVGLSPTVEQQFFSPPPAVDFLRRQQGFFRIAPFVPYLSEYTVKYGISLADPRMSADIGKNLFQMNWALWYGQQSVIPSGSFMTARPVRAALAVAANGATTLEEYQKNLTVSPEERMEGFRQVVPLLQLMSVRFVLSSFALPEPFRQASRVETATGYPVITYEVPDPLPFAFLAQGVHFIPEGKEKESFYTILKETDVQHRTLIECDSCVQSTSETDASGTVRVVLMKDGFVEIEVDTDHPAWLVVSQTALPTWQATIDGVPAQIFRANYLYQSILVPSGKQTVVFRVEGFWQHGWRSFERLLQEFFRS